MARPLAITSGLLSVDHADLPRTVQLDGSASAADPGRSIAAWQWTVIETPEGSTAVLVGATTATPTLTVDRAGTYLVVLRVTDSEGEVSDTDVRTLPTSAYGGVEVPTQHLGFVIPAWQQRAVSRRLQRNWHTLDAELGDVRARLAALEAEE